MNKHDRTNSQPISLMEKDTEEGTPLLSQPANKLDKSTTSSSKASDMFDPKSDPPATS